VVAPPKGIEARLMKTPLLFAILAFCTSSGGLAQDTPHVEISGKGVPAEYQQAIAKTIEAARQICVERYGFDMPETIHVALNAESKGTVRLFNDGADRFSLTVRTDRDLKQPKQSGVFHIYGFCHETAHLAMYRPIKDHGWLTTAGAEGWAHWLGSHIVDAVYEQHGEDLWPDRYDYRADGTKRLAAQLSAAKPSDVATGAKLWGELAEIVGEKTLVEVFRAWGQLEVDPANPRESLEPALAQFGDAVRLKTWWDQSAPVLLLTREKSQFPVTYADRADLTNPPRELALDDGMATGKKSLAGGSHGVKFGVPDNSWYITSISIYGSRYGAPQPPKEDFEIHLCDEQNNKITSYKFPYSKFGRGDAKWVKFSVRPTNVPPQFIVNAAFNPTGTKGVYVSFDGEASGASVTGLPGRPAGEFDEGDWLIRVEVNQSKAADPLVGEKK
jgi:hypothetical protein